MTTRALSLFVETDSLQRNASFMLESFVFSRLENIAGFGCATACFLASGEKTTFGRKLMAAMYQIGGVLLNCASQSF